MISSAWRSSGARRASTVVLLVLGILFCVGATASAASAAEWKVAGSPLSGSASYATKPSGSFAFETVISGTPIGFTATGVESLESSIANEGGKPGGKEKLRFTGVTVTGAGSSCAVAGGTITTKELRTSLVTVNGRAYQQIKPAETNFFTWTLQKGTGSCVLAGSYNVTGSLFARTEGISNEQVAHELRFSKAIQTAGGGAMFFNGERAYFAGSVSETLTGTNSGQSWSGTVIDKPGEPSEEAGEGPEETLGNPPAWTVAGSPLSGSATFASNASGFFAFETLVGGTPIGFTATGVESLESSISNEGGKAVGKEKLRFTGVTVTGVGTCAVPGGTITTKELKTSLVTVNGRAYQQIKPAETSFFTWTLQNGTGSCVLAGSYNVTGSLFARAEGITTEQATHALKFSSAVQTTTGGAMFVNGERANFTGSIVESLTGGNSGQSWSAH